MKTIYRANSQTTRVEFKKDATGKIGCFFKQNDQVIDCKWYKSENAAMKWAVKVLA